MISHQPEGAFPMRLTTGVVLIGGVALGSGAATPLWAQPPDLSGQWTVNAAQSDNPRNMLQGRDSTGDEARGGRSGGGDPGAGGGRGGGGGHAGVGRRGGGGRGRVAETYLRSRDGRRLFVIVKCGGGGGRSMEFRRV